MNEPCYYRVSVKAYITDEAGRFLLAREKDGTWDMLGGGLDHGEDPQEALRREIQEEADLKVTAVGSSPQYFVTAYKADRDVYIASVVYDVTVRNLEFTPSDECEELGYFTVDEARQVSLQPNIQALLPQLTQQI